MKLHVTKNGIKHTVHLGETWMHVAYLGALFFEQHHAYVMIGGGLGLVVAVHALIGE